MYTLCRVNINYICTCKGVHRVKSASKQMHWGLDMIVNTSTAFYVTLWNVTMLLVHPSHQSLPHTLQNSIIIIIIIIFSTHTVSCSVT